MKLHSTLPLALAATLAACATSTPLPDSRAPALSGAWTLQAAPGLPAPPDGVRLVLRQAPPREGGQVVLDVSGFSGANLYSGQARVNASQQQLFIGPLTTTRMVGPEERMRFEGAYLQQLEKVGGYEWREAGTLVLKTLAGDDLTFIRADR